MGWLYEDLAGHEGWGVALTLDEKRGLARNEFMRELGPPEEKGHVHAIQAGCDCGWRSERMLPTYSAQWFPFVLEVDETTEARLQALWREHIETVRRRQW